jgi:hypothetical protein
MNFKSLLKNRFYIYPAKEFIIEGESLNIVENILKDAKFTCDLENNIEFLDSNYDYDIFKFSISERNFILKYSLSDSNNLLRNEFNLLSDIESDLVQHTYKNNTFKYGDYISYSIYSFEEEPSFKESGYSDFINNYNTFFECFSTYNKKPISKLNIDDYIIYFLNSYKIENLTIHEIETIKNALDLDLINSFLNSIKNEMKYYLSQVKNNNKSLCHGNLTASNILNGGEYFKFINFTQSFNCHEYYDVCDVFFNFKFPVSSEREYFSNFLKYKESKFELQEWELYKNYYNLIIRKKLIEYLFALIYEKYVLFFSRPVRIYSIVNDFSLSLDHFLKIPEFKQNYKYIADLFSSLILKNESN